MPLQPRTTFESPELESMHQGVIFLAAPVYQGNLQIDQRVADGYTLLGIMKDELGICVNRLDGLPVQVEINQMEEPHENKYGTSRLVRHKVFHEPVESVTFIKKLNTPGHYTCENATGTHSEHLRKFAEVLGTTALTKQRKLSDPEHDPKAFIVQPSRGGSYAYSPVHPK